MGAEPLDRRFDLRPHGVGGHEGGERRVLVGRAGLGRRSRARRRCRLGRCPGRRCGRRRLGPLPRLLARRRARRRLPSRPRLRARPRSGPGSRRLAARGAGGRRGRRLRLLACLADRPPAGGAPDGRPLHEHPAHVRDRLAADEPPPLEQPRVLAVELLERVVRQDRGAGLVGDLQDEAVASADGPGRRGDQLVVGDRFLVGLALAGVDPVREGGVDDDRDDLGVVLVDEGPHRLVELGEAGGVPPLGGDVGAVDDHMLYGHRCLHSSSQANRTGGSAPVRRHFGG